ncbi:hypothetical protein RB593_002658 [Gaeumannomyces tritici]
MSLVPYHPREDREIVLRYNNALVVRDRTSSRLEIQRVTDCPTCHRPLNTSPADRQYDAPPAHDSFVSPGYFRLLQPGGQHDRPHHARRPDEPARPDRPPSSPVRRLVHRVPHVETAPDPEFVSSEPAIQEGARIRKSAFSPNYFRDFFVEEHELGRGGKGVVLLVRHQLDGVQLGHYACKRVPVGDDHAWLEKVLVEVELLASLTHPNLVAYRHVWLEEVKLNRFGPSVACAFILQQYCNGGDLLRYVVGALPKEVTNEQLKERIRRRSKGQAERTPVTSPTHRRLPLEEIYSIFKDITSGLVHLHDNNYIHRDLKPSNCLLHRQGKTMICLISDFGEVQQERAMRSSTGSTGTISYCAPEVLVKDSMGRYGNFTTKSDIFSLGMILYFLCFGRLPYHSANTLQEELEDVELLRAEIADWKGFQDERRERPDLPSKLYSLLKRLLSISPNERPSAPEVLSIMKNESALDSVPRRQRSGSPSSIGLSGRRIQSLDSPHPPSTPVNEDPAKQSSFARPPPTREEITATPAAVPAEADSSLSPQPTPLNSIQKHPNPTPSTPRHRPPPLVTSHGHESLERRSPSPSGRGRTSPAPPGPIPLLMPPPTTPLEHARHQVVVAHHNLSLFLARNAAPVVSSARLALFVIKIASLTRPCWPYVVNPGVGASLVVVAGMDLAIPATVSETGPYTRRLLTRAGLPSRPDTRRVASLWRWDWRVSLILLVLHFFVLWAAFSHDRLCTALQTPAGWPSEI